MKSYQPLFALAICCLLAAGCGDDASSSDTTTTLPTADTTGGTDTAKVGTDTASTGTDTSSGSQTGTDTTTGGDDKCSCAGKQCGFIPGCTKSCGACGAGKKCVNNQCVQSTTAKLKKFGEFCGPTKACQPAAFGASQTEKDAYRDCLNALCDSGLCNAGICTKECQINTDKKINHSGENGSDGIEDPDVDSDCADAVKGPMGDKFRCVEYASEAQVQQGSSMQLCEPGTTFKPCKNDGDCTAEQTCQLMFAYGMYSTRCSPRAKNPDGSKGAAVSATCNNNIVKGEIATCESKLCFGIGCVSFCKTDGDCVSDVGSCKDSKCPNGSACGSDADCSAWFCNKGQSILGSDNKQTHDVCWPKSCKLDADCPSDDFFCRIYYNGVKKPRRRPRSRRSQQSHPARLGQHLCP